MRERSEPARPRFGMRPGGSSWGLSGRAGKRGIATSKEKSSRPCFQARAAARLAITFCAGSAVSSTWRAASAIEFRSDLPGGGKHGLGMARHLHLAPDARHLRSEEHTSELPSLMRISYAVFCLTKKTKTSNNK